MNDDPIIIEGIDKGECICKVAERLVHAARTSGRTVKAEFNGTRLIATPESTADEIIERYHNECARTPAFLCDSRGRMVGTTLYVAAFHDRHTDPVIRVFTDQDTAIAWARKNFRACLANPKGYRENTACNAGVVWAAWYTYEADKAWVERVELDDVTDFWGK